MTRWEYKEEVLRPEALNKHGAEGWELVSVFVAGTTNRLCVFKRPLPEKDDFQKPVETVAELFGRHQEHRSEERERLEDVLRGMCATTQKSPYSCARPRCENSSIVHQRFCPEHTCSAPSCYEQHVEGSRYCAKHTCLAASCFDPRVKDSSYCYHHTGR